MFSKKTATPQVHQKGFSLIEVLITSAIIGIVTAIVVIKYGAFNSSVLLKNQAYEVALAIREAQVFSVSVRGEQNMTFRDEFGVFVDQSSGPTQEVVLFVDSSSGASPEAYDDGEEVETLILDSRFEISEVCVVIGGSEDCSVDNVSIVYARPDFDAEFHADGSGAGIIDSATLTLVPVTGGPIARTVEVNSTGQISVQ